MTTAVYPVSGGGSGTGDVVGPVSSVNNGLALFDGVTGKLIKDAGVGSANQVLVTDGSTPSWSGTPTVTGITLSDFSTGFKYNNGTANVLTIEANVPTGAQTLTIPVIAAASTFILNRGSQSFENLIFFKQGASVTTSLYMSATLGGNEYTITPVAPAANRAYSIPDAGSSADFVLNAGNSTIGGTKTFSSGVVINPTTNQLVLGVTNTTTINSVAPAASRVYTIPDAGGAASFVMTTSGGTQTIGGTGLTLNPTTLTLPATVTYSGVGSIVKAGAGALTLTNASAAGLTFSGAFTLTVPATGTADLIGTAQTISAIKTHSEAIAFSGGTAANLSIWAASNVLRQRGGTSGWAVDNTSGTAIISATDAGAVSIPVSLTTPSIIGGSSVSQVLTIKSTTGIGSSDRIDFTVGNNGAVTGLSIGTTGAVTIGAIPATSNSNSLTEHLIAGHLSVATPSGTPSGDEAGFLYISANASRSSGNYGNRFNATPGGTAILLNTRTTASNVAFAIEMNQPGDTTTTAAVQMLTVSHTGAVTLNQIHNRTDGNVNSGRYTPTITGVANVASSGTNSAHYTRVGNTVTVSGYVTITATAAAPTATAFRITLPIASNMTSGTDCAGAASANRTGAQVPVIVTGDPTNDQAYFDFNASSTSVFTVSYTFQYEVK
jgi:hypothetical protein